jgi:hypothetical protein
VPDAAQHFSAPNSALPAADSQFTISSAVFAGRFQQFCAFSAVRSRRQMNFLHGYDKISIIGK